MNKREKEAQEKLAKLDKQYSRRGDRYVGQLGKGELHPKTLKHGILSRLIGNPPKER